MEKTLSELYGIDVSEFDVVQLTKAAFQSVNFNLYPPQRTHFLIYAIQFQLKLPKQKTMIKSEKKNEKHTLKKKKSIEQTTLQSLLDLNLQKIRIPFILPCKYGPQPIKIPFNSFSKNSVGIKKGSSSFGVNSRSSHMIAKAIQPVSSFSKSKTTKVTPKKQNKAFILKSSEQIVLKAARTECRQNVQKWRQQRNNSKSQSKLINPTKSIPQYFKKKKANQKRRRLEKHELIKENKKQLVEIYGEAIFNRGWPVGRKQIRQKLGIKDNRKSPSLGGIADMMRMTNKSSLSRTSIKNDRSPPISMKPYIIPYQDREIIQYRKRQPTVSIDPNDFPSLLSSSSSTNQSYKKAGKKP